MKWYLLINISVLYYIYKKYKNEKKIYQKGTFCTSIKEGHVALNISYAITKTTKVFAS